MMLEGKPPWQRFRNPDDSCQLDVIGELQAILSIAKLHVTSITEILSSVKTNYRACPSLVGEPQVQEGSLQFKSGTAMTFQSDP